MDILNSVLAEYCNADHTTGKLTLQVDINATPKELKTERDCNVIVAIDSLFATIPLCFEFFQYSVDVLQSCM